MPRWTDIGPVVHPGLATRRPIEEYQIRQWTSWQPDKAESQLQITEIPDLLNVEFAIGGAIEKRRGFTLQTDNLSGTIPAEALFAVPTNLLPGGDIDPAQIIIYITEADGRVWYQSVANLLASPNTDLVNSTSSMGVLKGQAGDLNPMDEYAHQVFGFNGFIYITGHRYDGDDNSSYTNSTEDGLADGATKALKYDIDGDSWSRVAVPNLSAGGTVSGVPRAAAVLATHDRVFYANVASQDVYDYGDRIYWSNPGTVETINASTNYIVVGLNDGTQIRKLISRGSEIMVFKEESVWALVGTDEDTFALYNLSTEYGTKSANSVAVHKNMVVWLDPVAGVMTYDGANFNSISQDIILTLRNELNLGAVYKACGFVDSVEEKYYLSIPVGDVGDTIDDRPTVTYVYDFRLQTWTRWDYGFSAAVRVHATFHGTSPVATDGPIWTVNNDGTEGIFEINDGYSDNGVAYNSRFETIWMNPGNMGDSHRLRRVDILSSPDQDTVAVSAYRNFDDNSAVWKSHTYTPTLTGDEYHEQSQKYSPGLWTWIKFKFANNSSTESFDVNGLAFSYSSRPSPRRRRAAADLNTADPLGEV